MLLPGEHKALSSTIFKRDQRPDKLILRFTQVEVSRIVTTILETKLEHSTPSDLTHLRNLQ